MEINDLKPHQDKISKKRTKVVSMGLVGNN